MSQPRRLVEQRSDWDAIGRRFGALVEETVSFRNASDEQETILAKRWQSHQRMVKS